jgi:hypothetical protein
MSTHMLSFEQLSVVLQNNAHRKFHYVFLPRDHVLPNASHRVTFLGPFSQYIIHQLLVCGFRDGHEEGYCYEGNFTLDDILISSYGHLIINSQVAKVNYHQTGGQEDCDRIHEIIHDNFLNPYPQMGKHPIHVEHLLNSLKKHGGKLGRNRNFVTFIIIILVSALLRKNKIYIPWQTG